MYAVVDLETTGMRTSWHDRVLEIAVVRLDESGRTIDEWCTLVNPDRDLGPQEIHGITAAEARRAPRFADLAGQVAERLAGHTVVAHNLIFDAGFLTAEFAELGYQVPVEPGRGLCTMRLAGHFLPTAARSLQACRSAAGLGRHRAHSARHDARAAAELFAFYLRQAGRPAPWAALVDEAQRVRWLAMVRNDLPPVTRRRAEDREPHFLTRLVDRLPRLRDPQGDAYLDPARPRAARPAHLGDRGRPSRGDRRPAGIGPRRRGGIAPRIPDGPGRRSPAGSGPDRGGTT